MATRPRTFKVFRTRLEGEDVRLWQQNVVNKFASMNIGAPIVVDGIYGPKTHSTSCKLVEAMGINSSPITRNGLTIGMRRKVNSTAEKGRAAHSKEVQIFRNHLRDLWGKPKPQIKVSKPVATIVGDSWGYHPGVHDGVDVICLPNAPVLAMVRGRVIDVRSSGWWGLGAQASQGHPISDGDGIIQIEVLDTVGPFRKGMQHIAYGHAEKASVKVGQIVRAGQKLGHAGFANAWHVHLMVNDGSQGRRGVGTTDPAPFLNWTKTHG